MSDSYHDLIACNVCCHCGHFIVSLDRAHLFRMHVLNVTVTVAGYTYDFNLQSRIILIYKEEAVVYSFLWGFVFINFTTVVFKTGRIVLNVRSTSSNIISRAMVQHR